MYPLSDIDIFLHIYNNSGASTAREMITAFDMSPLFELDPLYARLISLADEKYLYTSEHDIHADSLPDRVSFMLAPRGENALSKYLADKEHEKALLKKSSKDHKLAVIGAISGLFGGATGLIALLLQLFQNTPPPAP